MNAQTSALQSTDEIRASLMKARDTALGHSVTMPHGWAREINVTLADIANYMGTVDAPGTALDDAMLLTRLLIKAQTIAGTLQGIYPTDRYTP